MEYHTPIYDTIAHVVTTALNPAKIALPQFADKKSAYNTKQENDTITHGMVTYNSGEAVRLLTFDVRIAAGTFHYAYHRTGCHRFHRYCSHYLSSNGDGISNTRTSDNAILLLVAVSLAVYALILITISDSLKSAIGNNHISLLYQPLFSLRDRTISALTIMPLTTDDDGHRLDVDFIVSETRRLRLGCKLTLNMLDIGARDLLEFRNITPQLHILTLALNGSGLGDFRFYERLETLNTQHPDILICLEFGEMALNTAKEEFDNELEELTSMPNVDIALTRAGTTYSEFSTVANIPLSTVKLDSVIINNYHNPRAVKLAKRAIQISADDGIHLVFSGIDTVEQTALLNDIGAHNAQGNMYASAMTASEMRMRLETMGLALGTPEPMPAGHVGASHAGERNRCRSVVQTGI